MRDEKEVRRNRDYVCIYSELDARSVGDTQLMIMYMRYGSK